MPTQTEQNVADKRQVVKFLNRFEESDRGLDFHNDTVRAQFSFIMQTVGFTQEQIDTVLGVGAVYESPAQQALNRNAIQSDVDAVRAVIRREELQFAYQEGFANTIQPALQTGTQAEIVAAIKAVADAVEVV